MRKTIIPAAIVLAAPAVTMQAQAATLTPDAVQKEISAVSTEIGTYPKAVQDMFSSELSQLENDLRKVRDNAEMTDEQKAIKYATIIANAQDVQKRAKEEETKYQTAKKDAVDAWDAARTAYTTAYNNINSLSVPSVKEEYLKKLRTEYPQPADYTDDDLKALYESIEESEKIESARNEYTANVEQLVKDAQNADSKEQADQLVRQDALEELIKTAKGNVQPTYNDVYSYVDYTDKTSDLDKTRDLATISGVTTALEGIAAKVADSCTDWELTAEKADEYNTLIQAQVKTLNTTAEAAKTAALAKAVAGAAEIVRRLTKNTEYTDFGPDKYTTDAKNAANTAIKDALDAEVELAKQCVQTQYNTQADVVNDLVNKANNAITAVTSCENNYKAYDNLKKTYETLKAAYDKAAIELSGLKANSQIADQYYNEANTKLNEVAKMIETFATTNQDKYDKYDGKSNADYSEVMNLLDPAYDEANEIQQIVDKAKTDNATLAKLTGYQTQVQNITATVSHDKADDNEVYAAAVSTLKGELSAKKSALATELAGLVTVWRTNKTLGNKTFADIEKEISDLNAAITTAQADLNAYVSSKEQVATWTASVETILKKIPNPVSQDYLAHADLENDRTQATNYQSAIFKLGTDADNAFDDSPRTSKVVWENIQNGTNYTTVLETLSDNVDKHLTPYQEWLDEQGDVAAYNLGVQYYTELQADLKAAKDATADNALGFEADQKAINDLKTEVDKHKDPNKHQFNDCIAAMQSWQEKYKTIKQSIADHKQAWETNNSDYEAKWTTLSGILAFEATLPNLNLYTKLNPANQGTIDAAIADAQAALNTAHAAQNASSFDAAAKQTEILNLIAQLKLQEELDAPGIDIAGAISTVRTQLATEGWNPENFYGKQLDGLKAEYDTFTGGVKYADSETKSDYLTKSARIAALKAAILAVATDAKNNYTEYTKQQKAQADAKAVWADIYSKVGAMYVATGTTNFSDAQKRYQDQLNECFTVLTGYDTLIEEAYNAGTSKEFNTTEYGDSIAANKKAMDGTYKAAYDNKHAYDGQMEKWGTLVNNYDGQVTALQNKIDAVVCAIAGASETDVKDLKKQETTLNQAKDNLAAVQTNIDNLKKAVVAAVNEGHSVEYAADYEREYGNIDTTINTIIGTANDSYNANIAKHNAVVKKLFEEAYYAAKNAYNNYTFQIEAYAGYKHALNENGVSAYAKAIEEAQKAIFDLNTDLVAKYNDATKELSSTTEYVDKGQTHKAAVNTLKAELDDAYNDFLVATKDIADEKGYAQPLSDLATYYTNAKTAIGGDAKTAIAGYDIITGITATPDEVAEGITDAKKQAAKVAEYFTFDGKVLDGTALHTAYTTAGEDDNEGPQQLDELLAQVEGQTAKVLTAWNNAAKDEAEAAKSNADESYKFYEGKKYPRDYTAWAVALYAANNAIVQAGIDITTYSDTKELNVKVDGIKTALSTAISDLSVADTQAATDCEWYITTYNTYLANIEQLKEDIADGYENHQYKAELTKLIDAANDAVTAYKEANETAFNSLYDYETSKKLSAAQNAAEEAFGALVATADELVAANQPAGIVKTLLAKAQELVPLYNRAEANAKGESGSEAKVKECEEIYKLLNSLLVRLDLDFDSKDPGVLEKIENEAAAQKDINDSIEDLRQKIIAADVEQHAYDELLKELNGEDGVKASLDNVKAYIENSTFKTELNEAFSERIAALDIELSAALTQINIDHANNHCGKTEAVFKGFTAISESIATLDDDVKIKASALQTAKDHADMRAKNTVNYEAARDAIANADNKLQAEWFNAQESFKDVFTLFNERVKELRSNIATLQDNLTNAYNTAQNEGGVPSDLNTDAYTAKAEEYSDNITNLMGNISARQAQFEAEVRVLNSNIADMKTAFDAIVNSISDIAAANEDVQKEQIAIDKAIDEIEAKMQNFGPEDTKDVQDMIDAANARITAFAELVAGKTYVPGDITGTGSVDINDTFKILDLVLGKLSGDTLDEKAHKAADMDGDGKYTVVDLVQINNLYVYGSKTGPQGSNKVAAAADAEVGSVDMQLDTDRMSVLLDSNTGYSAIQMDVEMPQGVSINEVNFAGDSQKVTVATNTLENGVQRIVLYSSDGSSILNGESSLLNLGLAGEGMGIVSIDNIIASTAAGQRHNLMAATGAYTIVTGIEATETTEGNTSVFDINGMVRKTVQKGINIVKDATGKVKKMLMK